MRGRRLAPLLVVCFVFFCARAARSDVCVISDTERIINDGREQPNGVPNYRQRNFPGDNDCGPTAAAMLLGYYDANGWPRMVPGGRPYYQDGNPSSGLSSLVQRLQEEMPYDGRWGTWDWRTGVPFLTGDIGETVTRVAAMQDSNASDWSSDDDEDVDQGTIRSHIRANRPLMLLVKWNAIDAWDTHLGRERTIRFHWMTIIGYKDVVLGREAWGCRDSLAVDDFYVVMRSGFRDGGNSTLWYNWSVWDDLYTVEVWPSGSGGPDLSGSGGGTGGGAGSGGSGGSEAPASGVVTVFSKEVSLADDDARCGVYNGHFEYGDLRGWSTDESLPLSDRKSLLPFVQREVVYEGNYALRISDLEQGRLRTERVPFIPSGARSAKLKVHFRVDEIRHFPQPMFPILDKGDAGEPQFKWIQPVVIPRVLIKGTEVRPTLVRQTKLWGWSVAEYDVTPYIGKKWAFEIRANTGNGRYVYYLDELCLDVEFPRLAASIRNVDVLLARGAIHGEWELRQRDMTAQVESNVFRDGSDALVISKASPAAESGGIHLHRVLPPSFRRATLRLRCRVVDSEGDGYDSAHVLVNGVFAGYLFRNTAGWEVVEYDLSRFLGKPLSIDLFVRIQNADGRVNLAKYCFDDIRVIYAPPPQLCLGFGDSGMGWCEVFQSDVGSYHHSGWLRLHWSGYNLDFGEVRPATGDVDGDGRYEYILAPRSGGGGWVQVRDDKGAKFAHLAWVQLSWGGYNKANGELYPACGDLDGDGRDELLLGTGRSGEGWFQVRDDAAARYASLGWGRVPWGKYCTSSRAEVRPAAGDLDGDGIDEVVIGLGPGAGGWLAVLDDLQADLSPLGWCHIPWWCYNRSNGSTQPACGDLSGDGKAELVVGLGKGSRGWMCVFDDLAAGMRFLDWANLGEPKYNAAVGITRPACGDLNGDGTCEVVVGLGDGGEGCARVFGWMNNWLVPRTWIRTTWSKYKQGPDGETWPAVSPRRAKRSAKDGSTTLARVVPPEEDEIIDNDRDEIDDEYEDWIMRRFAPEVRLHSGDQYRPSPVGWYLNRVHMRFHHARYFDCQILGTGVWGGYLSRSHERDRGLSGHSGPRHHSGSGTTRTNFFLQIPNNNNESTTRRGSGSARWRCYAHVRYAPGFGPGTDTRFDIQYLFFYPYNGNNPDAGLGAHEGDWEHVTVRVSGDGSDTATVVSLFYAQHNGGTWYTPSQVRWNGNHPIVYSAFHSHASYPTTGSHGLFALVNDYTNAAGPRWYTWNDIVNVGERDRPRTGMNFIQYTGRWGELGEVFSGPRTPSFQSWWHGD